MIYKLTTPITVGDFTNRITISELKLISISINFADSYTKKGVALLSISLADTVTGYPLNLVYGGADALAFWNAHSAVLETDIFNKLIADKRLPEGTLNSN